tara:strand:+ start:39 stop:1073 length:1035 start_codon:yes stop_codon:yes gene_type:complete
MKNNISVAVLGSTGYVGLELVHILLHHPNIKINYLGSESNIGKHITDFDKRINDSSLPKLNSIENIDLSKIDLVFLALPHGVSQKYVKENINKTKIIDLSADFRIDDENIYNKNYNLKHLCPNLLNNFIYGLPEINFSQIKKSNNVSVPGCYPTSVLLPLIPLIKDNLIKNDNIIIDSKSGYSGAGKKFDKTNLFLNEEINFYNYNTNNHRHMSEISQELLKYTSQKIKFSFNPHVLPIFRGMMSTIYCDLNDNVNINNIKDNLKNFYLDAKFVKIIENQKNDFFYIQNTNNCLLKLFNHYDESKIIIVSLIDNLLKGASGQAVQCMNIMLGYSEDLGLEFIKK